MIQPSQEHKDQHEDYEMLCVYDVILVFREIFIVTTQLPARCINYISIYFENSIKTIDAICRCRLLRPHNEYHILIAICNICTIYQIYDLYQLLHGQIILAQSQ